MSDSPAFHILPAEWVGQAKTVDGVLDIGGVKILAPWWNDGEIAVYVRRASDDLSVIEICMAKHDGLDYEQTLVEDAEAERYPLGPREYWSSKFRAQGWTEDQIAEYFSYSPDE